jgi:hypothetical protein
MLRLAQFAPSEPPSMRPFFVKKRRWRYQFRGFSCYVGVKVREFHLAQNQSRHSTARFAPSRWKNRAGAIQNADFPAEFDAEKSNIATQKRTQVSTFMISHKPFGYIRLSFS